MHFKKMDYLLFNIRGSYRLTTRTLEFSDFEIPKKRENKNGKLSRCLIVKI